MTDTYIDRTGCSASRARVAANIKFARALGLIEESEVEQVVREFAADYHATVDRLAALPVRPAITDHAYYRYAQACGIITAAEGPERLRSLQK